MLSKPEFLFEEKESKAYKKTCKKCLPFMKKPGQKGRGKMFHPKRVNRDTIKGRKFWMLNEVTTKEWQTFASREEF